MTRSAILFLSLTFFVASQGREGYSEDTLASVFWALDTEGKRGGSKTGKSRATEGKRYAIPLTLALSQPGEGISDSSHLMPLPSQERGNLEATASLSLRGNVTLRYALRRRPRPRGVNRRIAPLAMRAERDVSERSKRRRVSAPGSKPFTT